MLTNDKLQSAIIANLKTRTVILATLAEHENDYVVNGFIDIREDNWQGKEYYYPNIRVRMLPLVPTGDTTECPRITFTCSIMVLSERASSLEADEICGIISTDTHGRSFTQDNINISWQVTAVLPAVISANKIWRSECLIRGIASDLS